MGLFSDSDYCFNTGDTICTYAGVVLPSEVSNQLPRDYMVQITPYIVLDGVDEKERSYGPWINDPIYLTKVNARFSINVTDRTVHVVATHPIKEGTEVFICYGCKFWNEPTQWGKLNKRQQREVEYNESISC